MSNDGSTGQAGDQTIPERELSLSNPFAGLRAIVTGGSSGIGAAVVEALTAKGAQAVVLDLGARTDGPTTEIACDVSDDAAVRRAVEQAAAELGGIDVVVNNAGIGAQGTIADNSDEEWHKVFDINVLGVVRVSRAALPYLRQSDRAAIVNTCSIAATAGLSARALYGATKGAVLSLSRHMATDHLAEGIRVNCVNPGTADTPWVGRLLSSAPDPVAERAALEARQPHGRLVAAAEIADAVCYLASPLSRSTTGTDIAVDGGMEKLRPAVKA